MKSNKEILEYLKKLPSTQNKINYDFIEGWSDALNFVFFNQEEEDEIEHYLETHEYDKKELLTHFNGWIMAYKWLLKD